jgi:hypothetical protein
MLTIFSIPKAFKGHIGTIQRNAVQSWTLLHPRPEIILFGNDEGTAQVAREFHLRHLTEIASNEHGTPILSDIFRQAESHASFESMCYVNADILVLSDFLPAVSRVSKKMQKFLILSERINLDITEPMAFEAGWESPIKSRSRETGVPVGYTGMDIFAFPKGTYPHIPDFAIGRLWFDQWLIKGARENKIPVVDVTRAAPVIHQNHDYNHVPGGANQVWRGKEADVNLRLYGSAPHSFTFLDVTHELTPNGSIRRVFLRKPAHRTKEFLWRAMIEKTQPLRRKLGLQRKAHASRPAGATEAARPAGE